MNMEQKQAQQELFNALGRTTGYCVACKSKGYSHIGICKCGCKRFFHAKPLSVKIKNGIIVCRKCKSHKFIILDHREDQGIKVKALKCLCGKEFIEIEYP